LFDAMTLSSGDYFLNSLTIDSSGDLHLDLTNGPIRMFVKDDFRVDGSLDVFVNNVAVSESLPPTLQALASQVLFEVHDDVTIDASITSSFFGTIFAPNSSVDIQVRDFFGTIYAGDSVRAEAYLVHVPSHLFAVAEPGAAILAAISVGAVGAWRHRSRLW
jgi:hypothetical protein